MDERQVPHGPRAERDPPEEQPDAERGKVIFETRGCLACHQHKDFPKGKATHGPDLSRIGAKLSTQPAAELYGWSTKGALWLYSWVRQPNRYHARTVMPDTFLDPIREDAAFKQFMTETKMKWEAYKRAFA